MKDLVAQVLDTLGTRRTALAGEITRIDSAMEAIRRIEPSNEQLAEAIGKGASKSRGGGGSMRPPEPAPKKRGPYKKAAAAVTTPAAPPKKGSWGKLPKAHGVPGEPGKVQGEPIAGGVTCEVCGRDGLQKSPGPGGYLRFHRAPCELPCNGANLAKLSDEDRADGTHSKKSCPKCGKKEASA